MTQKGILSVLNNGIEFIIGSIVLIVVTNLYTIEEAGAWVVFITFYFIGTKFREGITQGSLVKFSVGVSKEQTLNVYMLSILITIGIEAIVGISTWFVGTFFLSNSLSLLLVSYFALSIPQSLYRLFQFFSQSRLEIRKMLVSNIILVVIVIIGITILIMQEFSFGHLPWILGSTYVFGCLWQYFDQIDYFKQMNFSRMNIPKGYIHFALNGVLRELFGTLSSRAYILLTAGMVGYAESAIVGIASRYANLIYLPNTAYQGILYPKACEYVNNGYHSSMFGFYRRSVSWMQAAFIPLVIVVSAAGVAFILLFHGKEYLPSIPFFVLLVFSGAFIAPFGHAFGSVCQATGRPELVTKVVFINSVLNLMLSLLMISKFGVWGAVIAPIFTDIIGLGLLSIILKRVYSQSITESILRMTQRCFVLFKIINRYLRQRRLA